MTENEAIKIINDKYETFFALSTTNDFDMAMATAIKALEEIQQYRAIGTVEQLEWCKDASHWKELFKEKLEKYEAIGTVEDIQMIFQLCKDLQVMCGKYHAIGTVDEFKAYKQGNCTNNCKHYDSTAEYVRNNAIDKFVEKITLEISKNFILSMLANYENYGVISDKIVDYVIETSKKIAEQMKGGAENE